jgi:hypothetical protein
MKKNEMCVACRGTREMCTEFWWGNLKEDLRVDGIIILKLIFKKWNRKAWTGFIWLRIGTGGRSL